MNKKLNDILSSFNTSVVDLEQNLDVYSEIEALMRFAYVAGMRDGIADTLDRLDLEDMSIAFIESEAGDYFHKVKLDVMNPDNQKACDLVFKTTHYWTPACSTDDPYEL
jgi:hypothetical protein